MSVPACPVPLVQVRNGLLVFANEAFRTWLGAEVALDSSWLALFSTTSGEELECLASQGWFGLGERLFLLPDGRYVGLLVTLEDDAMWVAFHDCTARRQLEARMMSIA